MAFSAFPLGMTSATAGSPNGLLQLGNLAVDVWLFTETSSDTGGTFTTTLAKVDFILAFGGDKTTSTVGATASGQTVTVSTQGSAGSTTTGVVLVFGRAL